MGYFLTVLSAYAGTLMAGVGIHLLLSMGGVLFLAVPALVQVAAYSYVLTMEAGLAMPVALLASLVITLLFCVAFISLHRRLSQDAFMVVSLASMIGVESLLVSWSSVTNGALGIGGLSRPELFNSLESYTFLTVLVAATFVAFEWFWLHSKKGRFLRAAKEHPQALESLGVSVKNTLSQVMLIAGVAFATGGWYFVWKYRFLAPDSTGIEYLIQIVTIGIIASKAQVRWVLLATAIVVGIPEIFRFLDLPSASLGYLRSIFYTVFLALLILKYHDRISISNRNV